MLIPSGRLGTATLILTPKVVERFGATYRVDSSLLVSVGGLYEEALRKSFRPVARLRSVADFEARARRAVVSYSKQYDEILRNYEGALGSSRFKLEYLKQITEVSKELRDLPFASLDLSELFRRHVACCVNAAVNYEELFESDSNKVYRVDVLLRTTNYGLTLLVLLLDGRLTGPLWIMGELRILTSRALEELGSIPEIRAKPGQMSGSLIFAEGELDVTPEIRKPR